MDRDESAPHLMDQPRGRMCMDESHRSRLAGVVRSFFPRPYIRHLLYGEPLPRGKGAFLFVDVSGFTRISEAVLRYGTLGTEMLTHALNRMFSVWIARVEQHDGVVYRFAGDAIYALFPGESGVEQAVRTVRQMMSWVRQEGAFVLPDGESIHLGLHAGLAWGRYVWKDLGNQDWVEGAGWVRAMRAAARASSFGLVAERRAAERLSPDQVRPLPYRTYRSLRWEDFPPAPLLPRIPEIPTQLSPEQASRLWQLLPRDLQDRWRRDHENPALHGEHRWMSVVFLYLRSPEHRTVAWFRDRLAEIQRLVDRTGGLMSRVEPAASGMRIVVLFGYPRMLDFPSREAARFLHYLRETLPPASFRGGLHGGTVFAGLVGSDRRRELTVMGDPVNTAARIAARAPWGTLWASREIQHRVQVMYTARDVRTLRLKGKKEPQQVAVLHPRQEQWRPQAFVGREEEYRTFLQHVRQTPRWVVGLSGEAGMGKSYFLQRLAGDLERMGFTVLLGYGVRDPLWTYTPFRVMLRRFLGTGPGRMSRLERYGLDREQRVLVGEILGMTSPGESLPVLPAEMMREARRRALRTLLYGIAQTHGSLVLLLDDVHWMDTESRSFLEEMWRHAPEGLALGVGCAFRPDEEVANWLREWPGYQEISLTPLDTHAVQQMARSLLGGFLDPRSLAWILSGSHGNPLVIHEWLRVLKDRQELVRAGRYWKLRHAPDGTVTPESVHSLVHQRVDTLPPEFRRVVQYASVLGMVFTPGFLADLLHTRVEHLPLTELQERGFVEALPEGAYRFVHTLIRDAVYHALSHRQRQQLHARAVQYLLQQAERAPELLLYHAHHAGQHRRTRVMGERLARLALRRQDTGAAVRFASWALAHLSPGREAQDIRARLLLLRAEAHVRAGDMEQALEDLFSVERLPVEASYHVRARIMAAETLAMGPHRYEEAEEMLHAVAPLLDQGVAPWVRGLWLEKRAVVAYHRGQYAEAVKYGEAALRIYEQTHRWLQVGDLINDLGVYYSDLGRKERAEQLLEESAAFSASRGDLLGQAITLTNLGSVRMRAGRDHDALKVLRQAEELCHTLGDPPQLKFVYWRMGDVYRRLKNMGAATRAYALALRYARQGYDRLVESLVLMALGHLKFQVGMLPMAIQLLRRAARIQETLGAPQLSLTLGYLADALALRGDTSRARKVLDRALRRMHALPQESWLSLHTSLVVLRLLAELEEWERAGPLLKRLQSRRKLLDKSTHLLLDALHARWLLAQGRTSGLHREIPRVLPFLEDSALDGEREMMACLLMGEVLVQTGHVERGGVLLRRTTARVFRQGDRGWLIRCGKYLVRYYRARKDERRVRLWQRTIRRLQERL